MGFSVSTATAIIMVAVLIVFEVLSGILIPTLSDIREAYEEVFDRAVEQLLTDINITGLTDGGWWDPGWLYRSRILINHSLVDSDQTDFPILVNVTSDDLRDYAQADGDDIAFISNDTVPVQFDHEIEYYDNSIGFLLAWVEIPTVYADVDTEFYMYFGNASCESQENIPGTWNSNFLMVQHLNETTGIHYDSTSNDNDGTINGSVTQDATGQIDGGDLFSGDEDEYITYGNDSSLTPSTFTLEAWVRDPPWIKKHQVSILDKQNEKISLESDRIYTIQRTISSTQPSTVVFAALSSPGVIIHDITIEGSSIMSTTYQAGTPHQLSEHRIEQVRKQLPEQVKRYPYVTYSQPFDLSKKETITLTIESDDQSAVSKTGAISYLLFSSPDTYDVECTTHWEREQSSIDWWNPFSVILSFFEHVYTFLFNPDQRDEIVPDLQDEGVFISISARETRETISTPDATRRMITQTFYAAPLAYYGETTGFTAINTTISSVVQEEPLYDYGTEHTLINTYFKQRADTKESVKCVFNQSRITKESPPGKTSISWTIDGLYVRDSEKTLKKITSPHTSRGSASDNTFVYPDVFGSGVHLEYSVLSSYVKELLTIEQKSSLPIGSYLDEFPSATLDFDVMLNIGECSIWYESSNGWTLWNESQPVITSGSMHFVDHTKIKIFTIPECEVWDSQHEVSIIEKQLIKTEQGICFTLKTPLEWLLDDSRVYPVYIDPTLTAYSTTNDGHIVKSHMFYTTAREADTGTVADTLTTFNVGQQGSGLMDANNYIWRGFVFFNTSVIPDSVTVQDATLYLYADSKFIDQDDFDIQIQNGETPYPHIPLQSDDYNMTHYSGNGGKINTTEIDPIAYSSITLTGDGKSWINKTGITKFCLRSSRDINGQPPPPPVGMAGTREYVRFYSSDQGANFPKLKITYTTPWWDETWMYRKLITIDSTLIEETLTNFPVHISLSSDEDLSNRAQSDGDDICFILDSDETKLNHEIESFNSTTGELIAWVNVPSIGNTTDTLLWMYYGNETCSSQENTETVWDDNYKAVWHMEDTDEAQNLLDSTSNDNDGAKKGVDEPVEANQNIYTSQDFDGSNDYVDCGTDNSLVFGSGEKDKPFTIEAWVNFSDATSNDFLGKLNLIMISQKEEYMFSTNATDRLLIRTFDNSLSKENYYASDDNITSDEGTWHYYVAAYSGTIGEFTLYRDGATIAGQASIDGAYVAMEDTNCPFYMGKSIDLIGADANLLDGVMDEVRVSNVNRSLSWINATYYTISDPSSFTTFGSEEAESTAPSISYIDPTLDNNTHTNETFINISVSSSDSNQHYTFLDFNKSLLLWMRMDDITIAGPDTIVQDLSSYGKNGVTSGNASQTPYGFYGDAFSFDGNGDYITINNDDEVLAFDDEGTYTWSCWVNLNQTNKDQWFFYTKGSFSQLDSEYIILLEDNASVSFAKYNNLNPDLSSNAVWSSTTLSADTWYHIAVTFNQESDINLYIDGVLVGSGSISINGDADNDLLISNTRADYCINGSIDEVLMYNRVLDVSEIQSLYNASEYQYQHNYSGLNEGVHNFTGYAVDRVGNKAETEFRNITIDTTLPTIQFDDPYTLDNNTYTNNSYLLVNMTTTDTNQHYAFLDFNRSLVGWWRMDDVSSTGEKAGVFDLSTYENHGTAKGNAIQTDNGYYGKAYSFDGDGDYIDPPDDIIEGLSSVTVSAWVKHDDPGSTPQSCILEQGGAGDDALYLSLYTLGPGIVRYRFTVYNDAQLHGDCYSDENYVDTSWHHIVGTFNGNQVNLYIDGAIADSTPASLSGIIETNAGSGLYISSDDATNEWYGTIDEVLIFNRALTLSEIQSLYNASAYQYDGNITSLSDGIHNFTGYVIDRAGNKNETEMRNNTIDTIKPTISLPYPPTLDDDTHTNNTYLNISMTTSDLNQHYAFLDFNKSLHGWWTMDNIGKSVGGDSTVFDDSSYGNDGTINGNGGYQTDNGFHGKAYFFDSGGAYIDLQDDIVAGLSQVTVSAWVKVEDPTLQTVQFIVEQWGDGDDALYLAWINPTGTPAYYFSVKNDDQTMATASSGPYTNDDSWHHVVGTYDGSFVDLFIDGGLVDPSSNPLTGVIETRPNSDVYISSDDGSSDWYGTIDEVLIFDRALTLSEIRSLYNATSYQYQHNFTDLDDNKHKFTGYAVDRAGNKNETVFRKNTVDTIDPSISFIPPTPDTGRLGKDYIFVNVSSSDSNCHYTMVDFNETLLLWLRMDEWDTGFSPIVVTDLSSYSNTGWAWGQAAQTDNGYYGKASVFDGDDDYIQVPTLNNGGYSYEDGNFSVSFWMKTDTTQQCFISDWYDNGPLSYGWYIQTESHGKIQYQYTTGGGGGAMTGNKAVNDDEWHHIVVVDRGGSPSENTSFYVDGSEDKNQSITTQVGQANRRFTIGGRYGAAGYDKDFNGSIDEMFLFNRSLSLEEVQSLYNASAYQYQHNFTDLVERNYTFTGYAVDRAGNRNETEEREINISYTPIVITNESTGVEETNATLHGYLQYDGGETCTVRFVLGQIGAIGTQSPNQRKSTGEEYENDTNDFMGGLSLGQLYKFYTWANNTKASDTGETLYFLTKPNRPTDFSATRFNQTAINLTWTTGDGANTTYIMRKTGTYPSNRSDGTLVYNGTGSTFNDTGLEQKKRFFYRGWSYANWTHESVNYSQWSDEYDNDTAATATLRLISCSTDKDEYDYADTVTFTAWVDAAPDTQVALLIADSISNLDSATYTNRDSCIANSTNLTVPDNTNQQLTATMLATSETTWYAKVCDNEGRYSYMYENISSWNKTYDGRGISDTAYDITTDSQDNIYVVGYGGNLNSTDTGLDWWIMKFNSTTGNREWNKTYDGKSSTDLANGVATDSQDNIYVVGYGTNLNGSTSYDWWIMKFNSTTGNREWNKTYNGYGVDSANAVATDSQDNIYVVGYGSNLNGSSGYDWWIMKFNSTTGNREWNKTYDGKGSADIAYDVAVDSQDRVYVVGSGFNLNGTSTENDIWIMRFNATTGVRDWNKTYDGGESQPLDGDQARSVACDSHDNVYVVGQGRNLVGDTGADWWILRFNGTTGQVDWNKSHDSTKSGDVAYAVTVDNIDHCYIAGHGYNMNDSTTLTDWWLKRFSNQGTQDIWTWNLSYDGQKQSDVPYGITTDSTGDVYIVGFGQNLNGTSAWDWWIKKFQYFTGNFSLKVHKEIIKMSGDTYSLELSEAGDKIFGYVNNTQITAPIDTEWHHVVLTYDGSNIRLFKDGELKNTTAFAGGVSYPTIISNVTTGAYLTGWADEIRIHLGNRSSDWINTSYYTMSNDSFLTVEDAEQKLPFMHINVTVDNTGEITLDIDKFTVLLNGEDTSFTCSYTYLYPNNSTILSVNVTDWTRRRVKVITENGISDYKIYPGR